MTSEICLKELNYVTRTPKTWNPLWTMGLKLDTAVTRLRDHNRLWMLKPKLLADPQTIVFKGKDYLSFSHFEKKNILSHFLGNNKQDKERAVSIYKNKSSPLEMALLT